MRARGVRVCILGFRPRGRDSTDFKEMLNYSPLDGVVLASPHFAHFENAKASLEKDCHVMIEKPMTTNSRDA